jgi:Tfp pilus assembly protein PilO
MTGRDRTVMLVAIVAVVLGLAWFVLVSPERKKAGKLDAQISSAQAQLASAEGKLRDARGAQSRYSAAYASVINLGKAVPPSQEVPSLIYQVTQAANEKNVDFTAISTSTTGSSGAASSPSLGASSSASSAAAASFTELPFTFTFEGGFFQLEHLFRGLDSFATLASPGHIDVSGRLLTVQSVKLAPAVGAGTTGSGMLSGTVTASAYVLPASAASTAAASPASPSPSATSTASGSSASSPTTPAIVKATP